MNSSFDEGLYTTDEGLYTTLEGLYTTDEGLYTTDESLYTTDEGLYTTDEGLYTTDEGLYTTDEGLYTIFKRLTSLIGVPLYPFVFFERAGGEGAAEREGDQVKSGDKSGRYIYQVRSRSQYTDVTKQAEAMSCRARKEEFGHRVG